MNWHTHAAAVAALALLFVLLSSSASAASPISFYCVATGSNVSNINLCLQAAIPYVIIALLFSFQLVAFTYLIGEVLNIGSLKGWYKTELWESVKSLLIVGLIFFGVSLLGVISGAINGATGNPAGSSTEANFATLYSSANNYLNNAFTQSMDAYYAIMGIDISVGYEESITYGYQFPIPLISPIGVIGSISTGVSVNPFASTVLTPNPNAQTMVGQTLTMLVIPTSIAIALQSLMMQYFAFIGLGVLLPLGIILRAVPFLRWIGGTFLALAIVGAFIYPALIVFLNGTVSSLIILPTPPSGVGGGCGGWLTPVCFIMGTADAAAGTLYAGIPSSGAAAYYNGYTAGEAAFYGGSYGSSTYVPVMNVLMDYALPVSLQFILFLLDLVIGVVAAQSIATALGGKLRLSLGKFKMA
jgi:hypothetical protein